MGMKRRRWLAALLVLVFVLGGGALLLWRTGFFAAAASLEGMRAYIGRYAPYSHLVFFLIQLLSVIIAPIPNNITALAGAVLFGTWPAFFLTAAAVIVGSMAVFALARALGRDFADRFVSKRISERYLETIKRKRDVFLALVFLFPFFPDDLICILAGLTDIGPLRFFVLVVLTRPWGLLVACLVGGSAFTLPLWAMALIGVAGVALFAVCLKYGDRWEEALFERFKK